VALVLVVDDDPEIREVITMTLVDEGHDVMAAADGRVALEMAAEHAPDVVLLDYNMPTCNAVCFMEGYCQRPAPRAPVVLVTAGVDARQRAAEIAADDFLGKPFDIVRLIDLVEKYAS
jgi:two-component system, chemotaxis family, chemotaxis protein CheY